ncbi:unnamed protein product, partial [marine sediment metagenome]
MSTSTINEILLNLQENNRYDIFLDILPSRQNVSGFSIVKIIP